MEKLRVAGRLCIFASPDLLADAAADEFFRRALRKSNHGGAFHCALSGGSTPRLLFEQLANQGARIQLPPNFWDSVQFFWGDERDVPPDHPDSNYGAARKVLLDRITIPAQNIHRIRPESGGAVLAAAKYEREMKRLFALPEGELPRFDLIFLGMGEDGHTASLFPDSQALDESTHLVTAPWIAKLNCYRITFTLPVINHAACVIFLISGAGKAKVLRQVLSAEPSSTRVPAQSVRPSHGDLLWLVDRAAASEIH
jgi:6-phosphogluconolactonase